MKTFFNKIKAPLIIVIIGAIVVGYYFYLNNRKVDNTEKLSQKTAVTAVTERNLELNYPGTPRAVLTFYCDILKVIYSESLSEKDIRTIANKLYDISDDEWKTHHPYEKFVTDLTNDIKEYKSENRIVADYLVEENSYIEYFSNSKQDYAKVEVTFFQHIGKKVYKTYEWFLLRKDSEGKWKMLYWEEEKELKSEK